MSSDHGASLCSTPRPRHLEKEHSISNHEHQLSLKTLPFLKGTKFVLLIQTHQERPTRAIYKHAIQTGTFYEAAK